MAATEESAPRAAVIEAVCPRCGRSFACCTTGPCWCGKEAFKLPQETLDPTLGCFCPSCLPVVARERLARQGEAGTPPGSAA